MKEKNMIKTEEYLTVKELSERIKYKIQSIYNMIYQKKYVLGKHYKKPSPKKILFIWSEIEKWLGDKSYNQIQETNALDNPKKPEHNNLKHKKYSKNCKIKI
jgi:predicted DNA-binding transcriptional regulator AlpA